MEAVAVFGVIGLVFGLVLCLRLFVGHLNHERIRAYVTQQGGEIISIAWNPFGTGWFGEQSQAIYEVRYLDVHGDEHEATCKTSMFTGVYWTEDRIVVSNRALSPQPMNETERLRDENARLKAELERLRRGR
jgi:hypothetical protein